MMRAVRFLPYVLFVGLLLALAGSMGLALAQVDPDRWFFEIDGDDGDWLEDTKGNDGEGYLPALDVNLTDGSQSWGRRQAPCADWTHTYCAPYMGKRSYSVQCEGSGLQRRTEQMLFSEWWPDSPDNSERYFSLAFRLVDLPVTPDPGTRGFIAQLHQGGYDPIPFRMQWEYLCPPDSGACRYYVTMLIRSGPGPKGDPYEIGPPIAGSQTNRRGIVVPLNAWTRMLFRFSTPGAAAGVAQVWLMDNSTGTWSEVGYFNSGPLGSPEGQASFQWKVGIYANDSDTIAIDYDNVAYGKRWDNITKNRLIGYHKSVLWLRLNGNADDYSWIYNGASESGDPVTDYDNDAEVIGATGSQWGRGYLNFNGTSTYVRVPMDVDDFDFGNYMTVSVWFRTMGGNASNKGLVMIDEYSTTWNVLLYTSDSGLSFGVRHPNLTYSKINYAISPVGDLADNEWHHVVGTFNRFAAGNRIKLYVDGAPVLEAPGSDLPVQRGDPSDYLVVGKFSSAQYFKGDIEDVNVFNFAMSAQDVVTYMNATDPGSQQERVYLPIVIEQ
ncbi:MAG TPA: LamG domain-containing protein [Anaerolineae bacterium]|nr:LamG domain-containing protein [Anaerolineae bacterium]